MTIVILSHGLLIPTKLPSFSRAKAQRKAPTPTRFEGGCEALKGHIYDCSETRHQSDLYVKTTKELADYVGSTFSHGGDARYIIENLAMPIWTKPASLAVNADDVDKMIQKKEVEELKKK